MRTNFLFSAAALRPARIAASLSHRAAFSALPAVLLTWALTGPAAAAQEDTEAWNAKFQSTYIWQRKDSFAAPYSGPNSLSPAREKSYSFTASAALGFRPWSGAELYFNPEAAQGVPLSGLTGLGGFSNAEIARTAGPNLTLYRARLFLRQTWGQGGGTEKIASDANQLAGLVDKRRLVLTVGNLSVMDIFDDNAFSHDPRTQFLNWSFLTHGAYDYAADARGYSTGVALEWYQDDWVLRAGRFLQPQQPNQMTLDTSALRHYGDQMEIEHAHRFAGRAGKIRLLAFHNRARMARFGDALALAAQTGATPDLNNVRNGDQSKLGAGISLEQSVTESLGLFARASWADGKTETYAFTEIDRSISGGLLLKGTAWKRAGDTVGVAFARNGLSKERQDYLRAGGISFFIGDGRLDYRPEAISEVFYNLALNRDSHLALDWQHIRNPAYNGARGPVNFVSLRLHTEF